MKSVVVGAIALLGSFVVVGCGSEASEGDAAQASTEAVSAINYSGEAAVTEEGRGQGYGNVPYTLSPGLFGVRGGLYAYSNGSAYCGFGSWEDFVALTGRNNVGGIRVYDGVPQGMANHGACQFKISAGFFRAGYGFYSNGDHYCACDRGGAPGNARAVHRRPDMPFDGSCGGC